MRTKRRWKISRVQTAEVVFATLLACATWSDPSQPLLSKTGSLFQLEMIAASIVRSWNQDREKDRHPEATKK